VLHTSKELVIRLEFIYKIVFTLFYFMYKLALSLFFKSSSLSCHVLIFLRVAVYYEIFMKKLQFFNFIAHVLFSDMHNTV